MKKFAIVFLAIALTAGYSFGAILYTQSFEDPTLLGGQYIDLGDALLDHDLVNNVGEAAVDGPGFDASYVNTRDSNGLTDGDYVGVTTWTASYAVTEYTDGIAGYQMSDCDGKMVLTFDDYPTAAAVTFDLFVQATGYESDDAIVITFGSTTILDTTGSDINDLMIEGMWMTYSVPVTGGALEFSLDSNSASEAIFIDNIVIADDLTIPNEDSTWSGVKNLYR
jgi:uncharacterized protein